MKTNEFSETEFHSRNIAVVTSLPQVQLILFYICTQVDQFH